tara:strand:+ start:539 stop:1057 length:519 start_codon:yes stop_codon:yes gene_type:complete
MRKVLLVLGLGLAMMSCSKEEIPVVEVAVPCEGGFRIIGFDSGISESGVFTYVIEIEREGGNSEWIRVSEDEWSDLALENLINGIACFWTQDDLTAPVISLTGEDLITVKLNTVYVDEGATAFDNRDGDLTSNIVTTSNVDTKVSGDYKVTYTVKDRAGNRAAAVIRVVIVN